LDEDVNVVNDHRQPAGKGRAEIRDVGSTIMVVDDDEDISRLLRTLFELEGHRVVVTSTYDEVLPLFRRSLPDAVLMDVLVQGRETIELIRQMRQEEGRAAQIPLVMTSAMDRSWECLEAGADLFVLKPFLPDELVQMVSSLSK